MLCPLSLVCRESHPGPFLLRLAGPRALFWSHKQAKPVFLRRMIVIRPPSPSVHPPVHLLVKPVHPHPPTRPPATEPQTKKKQNPLFISVRDPGTIPHSSPSTLLSRLFLVLVSVHLWLGPHSRACPQLHQVRMSNPPRPWGSRGADGAFPWLVRTRRAAPWGQWGSFRVWEGWGRCLRGSPVTRGPEVWSVEDDGGGRRRWRGLRSPQYTHP